MVILLVFRGLTAQYVANGVDRAKQVANGYYVVSRGLDATGTHATTTMIINSAQGPAALRNFLATPLIQVAAFRLQREWAAQGIQDLATWMQGIDPFF